MNPVPERTITITNTATYTIPEGSKLSIDGDKVYLNGMLINPSPGRGKEIRIELKQCTVNEVKCERVERIDVYASTVTNISSVGGRFMIDGPVGHDVSVMNGVVTCQSIAGRVESDGQSPIHVTGPPKPHITPKTHPHYFRAPSPGPPPPPQPHVGGWMPMHHENPPPLPASEGRITHVSKPILDLAGATYEELGPFPERFVKRARLLEELENQASALPEAPPPSSTATSQPEPITIAPPSTPRKRTTRTINMLGRNLPAHDPVVKQEAPSPGPTPMDVTPHPEPILKTFVPQKQRNNGPMIATFTPRQQNNGGLMIAPSIKKEK